MKPVIKDPVKKVSGLRAVKFESKKSKECAETIKVLKNCLAAAERGEVVGVSIVTVCDDEDSIDTIWAGRADKLLLLMIAGSHYLIRRMFNALEETNRISSVDDDYDKDGD